MKIGIHAVGRMKAGPEKELADRYLDRLAKAAPALGLDFAGVTEIAESRASGAAERRREEAARLIEKLDPRTALILLDERGVTPTSQTCAATIAALRDEGRRAALFAIGGADGHDASTRERGTLVWSFGSMTWPHQLVRIMLAEQLYRATTILSGHPYHRA
jgi:23S rRNA (pseudouridine1915-N3)-methyltransferase